jgi:site-specific DNA recombinase
MRVAIYARYSTDRQSESSAEDQARLCRDKAAREGWTVVAEFLDPAMSGATRNRPQLVAMMARAAEFDIVLAESLDRLSRDQEDIAAIHKRLRFAGVAIVTLADGPIGEMLIGVKGAMAAEYLTDLGDKTRRGQIGRVIAGRIPGGLSYGYERVHRLDARGEPERGLRAIREDEAAIVRRIFRLFLAGVGPREIARGLNAEGVAAPRGALWRASTITGHRQRRNGILYNDLYSGRILFNRQRFERDPDSRRRVARPNPRDQWQEQACPSCASSTKPPGRPCRPASSAVRPSPRTSIGGLSGYSQAFWCAGNAAALSPSSAASAGAARTIARPAPAAIIGSRSTA